MLKKLLFSLTILTFTINLSMAQSIGIIGNSTPGGWDADTDMTQDAGNSDLWTISMELGTGAAKFRQDDDWAVNWGSEDFPSGTGTQGGADIPVPAGSYDITFNTATGEYSFVYTGSTFGSIGLIGDATPGLWDADTNLIAVANAPWTYTLQLNLTNGGAKFRADDAWDVDWGNDVFPQDTGYQSGPNIPVQEGEYIVHFNSYSGEYNFENFIQTYNTIGLIGDATPGLWDTDTDMVQNPTNVHEWTLQVELTDGEAKFRAEDAWDVDWGSMDFPIGVGTMGGDNIPVIAGEYLVKFNSMTGDYSFEDPLQVFATIGIIGDATPGLWDTDTDMFLPDTLAPDQWRVYLNTEGGEMKFRADDDWAINWGAVDFPVGTGTQGGDNIMVPAGNWKIDFNATTGAYSFEGVTIGIIGTAVDGGWDFDVDMTGIATTAAVWEMNITLMDGEAKFRLNDDWAINWGDPAFPTGLGTQDGMNILVEAGTYDVILNTNTGEYSFLPPDATRNLLDNNAVEIFPNPTSGQLNINIEAEELMGDVTVHIMDLTGKVLTTNTYNNMPFISLDAGNLANGMYLVHISNDKFVIGKRFTIAK